MSRQFSSLRPIAWLLALALTLALSGVGALGGPATAAGNGSITGTVTGTGGAPLDGIVVTAYNIEHYWDGDAYDVETESQADGSYVVSGLTSGTYWLRFDDPSDSYLSEYYDDAPDPATAVVIEVGAGSTLSGKNAHLSRGSHLTGTVTGPGGAPLNDAVVELFNEDADEGWRVIGGTRTAVDGTYEIDRVRAGTYRIRFSDRSEAHLVEQWYDDAPSLSSATDVDVPTDATTISGLNAQLAAPGHITGTVTAPGGGPVKDVLVTAHRNDGDGWQNIDGDITPDDGSFDIDSLAPGTYRLHFYQYDREFADAWYDGVATVGAATDVAVSAGSTTSIGAARLTYAAHISGTVTVAGGGPGEQTYVEAFQRDGAGWKSVGGSYARDEGRYDIAGLNTGVYRLEFVDKTGRGYVTEYWDNASTIDAATDIAVTVGDRVTGKDAELERPILNFVLPKISGSAQVGSPLSATPGIWYPLAGASFRYRWLVGEQPVPGATSPSYVPVAGDVGKAVRVEVTGAATDYYDVSVVSDPTAAVLAGATTNGALPTIEGIVQIGRPVTAAPGAWSPAGATLAYQWLVDGGPIAGATTASYTPVARDVSKKLNVRVTATAPGYTSATATSATKPIGKGDITMKRKPKVTGKATSGATLKVTRGAWSTRVKATYQWYAGRKALAGATTAKIKLTGRTRAKVTGKAISVVLTITAPGYAAAKVRLKAPGRV